MLEALAQAIATSEIYPISSGIIVDDFFTFPEEQRKFFTGATIMHSWKIKNSGSPNKPYFVPFQKVLENVTSYTPKGRKAKFSFGVDRPVEKYAEVIFKQIKESAWTGTLDAAIPPSGLEREARPLRRAEIFQSLGRNPTVF